MKHITQFKVINKEQVQEVSKFIKLILNIMPNKSMSNSLVLEEFIKGNIKDVTEPVYLIIDWANIEWSFGFRPKIEKNNKLLDFDDFKKLKNNI